MMNYWVVIEKTPNNFGAYVPDLPGCVATGATREEVEREIQRAIAFHLEAMELHHEEIPKPTAYAREVEVQLPLNSKAKKAG